MKNAALIQALVEHYPDCSLTANLIHSKEGCFVVKAKLKHITSFTKGANTCAVERVLTSMGCSEDPTIAEDMAYERVLNILFANNKEVCGNENGDRTANVNIGEIKVSVPDGSYTVQVAKTAEELAKEIKEMERQVLSTPPGFAYGVSAPVISGDALKEAESRLAIAKQEDGGISPSIDKISEGDDVNQEPSFKPNPSTTLNTQMTGDGGYLLLATPNYPFEGTPIVPLTDDNLGELVVEPIPVTEAMPEKKAKKRSQPKEPVEAIAETPEVPKQIVQPSLELTPQPPSVVKAEGPIDFSEVIARTNKELKRLNWTNEQGKNYLLQTYGKRSRQLLSDEELLEFAIYLESLPSPE